MKIKSLYIGAKEKNTGALFVAMGLMEILKRNIHKVAYFKPIIKNKQDADIEFILQKYNLEMNYKECYGFDVEYAESMIAKNKTDILINKLITKFKNLEKKYDFILCQGLPASVFSSAIDFDINLQIAKNLSISYINIINANNKTVNDIYEDILIDNKNIDNSKCKHFATFVNRVQSGIFDNLKTKTDKLKTDTYLVKELEELNLLTIEDITKSLHVKSVKISKKDYARIIRNVKVAALSLDNFLEHIQEDDLIIVPPDRSDIVLGLFGALYSRNYPSISGIIFPFGMELHPNIQNLINGLEKTFIPLLSINGDTYSTAKKLLEIYPRFHINNKKKIAMALGLFAKSIDTKKIEQKIASEENGDIITPLMFEYKLFNLARNNKKTIVIPESSDERVLRACEIVLLRDVADIILLGKEDELRQKCTRLGLDISKAKIIDHNTSPLMDKFVQKFYDMRKHKGLTYEAAKDAMIHVNYFATMMVELGYAHGMVSGAMHSTTDTIRPALQIIKTKQGIDIVSSLFFMCLDTKVLVYGDCAINRNPNAKELAQITISLADSAKAFGIEPKVAMLSYSSGESGSGDMVDKVREATKLAKTLRPDLLIDGPMQYDTAINKTVAAKKMPNSKVAGEASVFVFPDLNTGNNTYKAVQRSSGAVAIGPILQGLKKPINDLSRGCLIEDIVNTIAITAIQAGMK